MAYLAPCGPSLHNNFSEFLDSILTVSIPFHTCLQSRKFKISQPPFPVIRSFSLLIFLYLFWLLLSGFFTPFLLASGVGCALAVTWFARRMNVVDDEGHPIQLGPRALIYWVWLFKEIIKSAWDVSKIIVHPKLPISPTLVRFKPSQKTEIGLVLHANSITLTPGTITIEAHTKEFLVHGLTRTSAQGVVDSEMDRRVTACEGQA